jgi:ATP-dependent protease ClpP protease subunit
MSAEEAKEYGIIDAVIAQERALVPAEKKAVL